MKNQTLLAAEKEVVLAGDGYRVVRTPEDKYLYIKNPDVLIEVEPVASLDYTEESVFRERKDVLDKMFVHLCHGKNTASVDGHQQYLWFDKENPDKYISSKIHIISRTDNSIGFPEIIVDEDGRALDYEDFWVDKTEDGEFIYDIPEEDKCDEDWEEYPEEVECIACLNYNLEHSFADDEVVDYLDSLFDSTCCGESGLNQYGDIQYLWFD